MLTHRVQIAMGWFPDTIPAKHFPYYSRENWGGATSQGFSLKGPSWVPPSASGGWILRYVRMSRSTGALNNHQGWSPRSMWYHRRVPDVHTTPCSFYQWRHKDDLGVTKILANHTMDYQLFGSKSSTDRQVRAMLKVPLVGFGNRKKTFSSAMVLIRLKVRPRRAATKRQNKVPFVFMSV